MLFFLQNKNPEPLRPQQGWILRTRYPLNRSRKQVLAGILICSIRKVNILPSPGKFSFSPFVGVRRTHDTSHLWCTALRQQEGWIKILYASQKEPNFIWGGVVSFLSRRECGRWPGLQAQNGQEREKEACGGQSRNVEVCPPILPSDDVRTLRLERRHGFCTAAYPSWSRKSSPPGWFGRALKMKGDRQIAETRAEETSHLSISTWAATGVYLDTCFI